MFKLIFNRAEFSKWWLNEFKTVRFPPNGNVFDFYVDSQACEMAPWVNLVPRFELDPDLPLQAVLVHTTGNDLSNNLFVSQNYPILPKEQSIPTITIY